MKPLVFSNGEIKRIVDTVSKGKKWKFEISSLDGKIDWKIENNPKKYAIDVVANDKYIDDYSYDLEESDDVYATMLNVIDYLTNIVNKYNKRNPIKEEIAETEDTTSEVEPIKIQAEADKFQEAISKGMLKAYAKKMKEGDISYTCKDCGHAMPKYKGRYPKICPNCSADIHKMKEADKDEAIWGGPFKRGEVVKVKLEDPNEFYNATLVTYNPATNEYGAKLADGDDVGKIIQGIKREQIK